MENVEQAETTLEEFDHETKLIEEETQCEGCLFLIKKTFLTLLGQNLDRVYSLITSKINFQ